MKLRTVKSKKDYMEIPKVFLTLDSEALRIQKEKYELQKFYIGYIYNGNEGFYFNNKEELLAYLSDFVNNNPYDIYIFAHNIKYDLKLIGILIDFIKGEFLNFKLKSLMLDNITFIKFSRRTKFNNKKITQNVIFLDSYQYLPSSQRNLEHDFLNRDKPITEDEYSLEPEQWNLLLKEKGKELVKDDAISLYQILTLFFNELKQNDFPFGYSLPSIAFNIYTKTFQSTIFYFPHEDDYNSNILESYRGGFVNVLELGNFVNVIDYDINSLYPYVMKNHKLPYAYVKTLSGITLEQYFELSKKYYIIAKVEFSLNVDISFIVKRINNKLISIKQGKMFLHEPEINYLIQNKADITFSTIYLYKYSYNLFDSYIDLFYKMKKENNNNKAKRTIAKLFLNSLYGKFGQHKNHTEYEAKDKPSNLTEPLRYAIEENGIKTFITDYGDFITYSKQGEIKYAPEIAGAISSYARMKLYEYVKLAGFENVIYCDTDSIHCKGHFLDSYVGDELGQLKIEKSGQGEYLAPKFYRINEDWTSKGINIKKDKLIGTEGQKQIWLCKRFEKVKTINKEGVIVRDVEKILNFDNDKFKFINNRAYSYTENEFKERGREREKLLNTLI